MKIVLKSLVHKYYKREGVKGSYKYYYTKEEYDKEHKTESKPKKDTKNDLSETFIIKRGLSKDWIKSIEKYINIVPPDAIPTVICNFTSLKNVLGYNIFTNNTYINRTTKYGVTTNTSDIKIPKELITHEIIEKIKSKGKGWFNEHIFNSSSKDFKILDFYLDKSIEVVGLNSSEFKNNSDLIERKTKINESYLTQTGNNYFINKSIEGTLLHELGHVYNNRRRISDSVYWNEVWNKWNSESNYDIVKNKSEAFSEAFSNYFVENGKKLPEYIIEYFKKHIK